MTSAFSWQNSVSLCPASFCIPRPNEEVNEDRWRWGWESQCRWRCHGRHGNRKHERVRSQLDVISFRKFSLNLYSIQAHTVPSATLSHGVITASLELEKPPWRKRPSPIIPVQVANLNENGETQYCQCYRDPCTSVVVICNQHHLSIWPCLLKAKHKYIFWPIKAVCRIYSKWIMEREGNSSL